MITLLLLTTMALAGEQVASYVPAHIDGGRASGPAMTASWTFIDSGCNVNVRLENRGSSPMVVDWTRSVISEDGRAASPLIPGTSSEASAMVSSIQPTVLPTGGYADVLLFRQDALPSRGSAGCLFTSANVSPERGAKALVTLSVNGQWWTQTITGHGQIGVSPAEVAAAEARAASRVEAELEAAAEAAAALERLKAGQAAVAAAQAEADARAERRRDAEDQRAAVAYAECLADARREHRYGRNWMTVAGIAAAGGGVMLAGGGIYELTQIGHPLRQENGYPVLGLGTLAVGAAVGAGIIGWKQHSDGREIEEQCDSR